MHQLARPLLVLTVLIVAGCYEYLPARNAAALVGQRIQLVLTDSGAVMLASQVGPATDAIEGTLVADNQGTYVVAMAVSRTRNGREIDWRGEQVSVPHVLAASVAERRFSVTRSALAGGLAVAGLTGMTVGLRGRGDASGSSANGTKPPPQ